MQPLCPEMKMSSMRLRVRLEVEKDGRSFHAYCPDLKGLHVDGATSDEALQNAKDAVVEYVKSMIRHDERLPLEQLKAGVAAAEEGKPSREDAHSIVEEVLVTA
jgi:predicted RNase H-like HicB family nuclease